MSHWQQVGSIDSPENQVAVASTLTEKINRNKLVSFSITKWNVTEFDV